MSSEHSDSSDEDTYGPAPPPGLKITPVISQQIFPVQIGPMLPPGLSKEDLKDNIIVQNEDSEEDDGDFGPMPADHPSALIPRPAVIISTNKKDKEKPKREEWMLIPPKNREISGLGPRKFLTRNPEDSNKVDEHGNEIEEEEDFMEKAKRELEEDSSRKRDEEMAKKMSGRKDKKESLLEIHRKNIKLEKDEEEAARKQFDRNTDLQICKLSDKIRKSI